MGTLNHTCHNPNCPNKKVDKDGKLLPNYYACDTCDKANGITWRALCCSKECFSEYINIIASQRKQAQKKVKAKAKTTAATEVAETDKIEAKTDETVTPVSEVVAHVAAKPRKRKKPVEVEAETTETTETTAETDVTDVAETIETVAPIASVEDVDTTTE